MKGADWFVDGASNIAKALKIPSLIIGLTLVSMGTSAPEAAVSITSAINKNVEMSVGNVIGSNIFNIMFILGLSAVITPHTLAPDALFTMTIMLLSGVAMLLIAWLGKNMKKWQGALMFAAYVVFIVLLILQDYQVITLFTV